MVPRTGSIEAQRRLGLRGGDERRSRSSEAPSTPVFFSIYRDSRMASFMRQPMPAPPSGGSNNGGGTKACD